MCPARVTKKKESALRLKRVPSSATFLTVVSCLVNALLKSVSGFHKFVGNYDRVGKDLVCKLGPCGKQL